MRPHFYHLLILNMAVLASCWGDLGHRTVAYLAEKYLTAEELKTVQRLPGLDDISDAAIWADGISKTPEYSYSASWHYINVKDNPPSKCGVELPRDHGPGSSDILTAFANHSKIATDPHSDLQSLSEAFRFLLHWVGDVHQPLHAEGLMRGGVDIPVLFDAEHTNLHIVWDVHILEKHRGGHDQKAAARAWAEELYSRNVQQMASLDKACSSPITAFECVVDWAMESNALVCSNVLARGVENIENQDLGGLYYGRSVPAVDDQIAKAGWRLAAWLRLILARPSNNDSYTSLSDYPPQGQLPIALDQIE